MNLFPPKILKRLKKKYNCSSDELSKKLKQIYNLYGLEISELLNSDDFLYKCLSKYLEPKNVQLWFSKVLDKNHFVVEYLGSLGMDPFNLQTQEKAINFIFNQINKNIILILQSTYDPNGAFDKNGDTGLIRIFKSIDEFYTCHYYINSLNDLKKIMDKIPQHKIAHLVLMAHGTPKIINLGKENITIMDESIFKFAEMLSPKMKPGATILLHSCSVGEGGG